jgi:hypothetical protein
MLKRLFALVATLFAAAPGADAGELVFPGNGRVGLVPPAGMVLAERFAGFQDAKAGASILILELPGEAFAQLADGLTDEELANQNIIVIARDQLSPTRLRIMAAQTQLQTMRFDATFLLVGENGVTAQVQAKVPEGSRAYPAAVVRQALDSIVIRGAIPIARQIAALPFEAPMLAGFRPVRTLGGSALQLTDGPLDTDRQGRQPMLVLASGVGGAIVPESLRAEWAERQFKGTKGLGLLTIEQAATGAIGGKPAVRLIASGTDLTTGQSVIAFQAMIFDGDRTLRLVGSGPLSQRTALLERFESVAAAMRIKAAGAQNLSPNMP